LRNKMRIQVKNKKQTWVTKNKSMTIWGMEGPRYDEYYVQIRRKTTLKVTLQLPTTARGYSRDPPQGKEKRKRGVLRLAGGGWRTSRSDTMWPYRGWNPFDVKQGVRKKGKTDHYKE